LGGKEKFLGAQTPAAKSNPFVSCNVCRKNKKNVFSSPKPLKPIQLPKPISRKLTGGNNLEKIQVIAFLVGFFLKSLLFKENPPFWEPG